MKEGWVVVVVVVFCFNHITKLFDNSLHYFTVGSKKKREKKHKVIFSLSA